MITFDPSNSSEIKKCRPARVISRTAYNHSANLLIVCPIISTDKSWPFLLPIQYEALSVRSKVNIRQVYSLDYTNKGQRNVVVIGKLDQKDFLIVAQLFMQNFNFPF